MNTINDIKEELYDSDRPIARAIHKTVNSSSICVGFKKGMRLKEHKTHKPTTLLVLYGAISYEQGTDSKTCKQYDQHEIPISILHAVTALEDSMIVLMMG